MKFIDVKMSLRVKVAVSITILIMLTAGAFGLFFIERQKQIIHQNLRERGLALASNCAYNAEYGVLSGNVSILDNLIEGIMRQPDAAYCVVHGLGSEILAGRGLTKDLLSDAEFKIASARAAEADKSLIQLIDIKAEQVYYDISVPVLTMRVEESFEAESGIFPEEEIKKDKSSRTRKIGTVRLGFSLAGAAVLIKQTKQTAAFIASVIILISSFLAILLIGAVLVPIRKLVEATQKISGGDLAYRVKAVTNDELGDLAQAFNKMTADLEKTTVSVEVLKKEQKRFSDVADNSEEWIWEIDAKGRYNYSSPAVEKILGYKPEEVIGRRFYDFFHPQDKGALKRTVLEIFSRRGVFRDFLNRNVHKDGRTVIIETSGVPIVGRDGVLLGYRGADSDITGRKKAEEEREALIRELEERHVSLEAINKELDDFTYIVSHDLKEPLRSIDAYSRFIADDYKDKLTDEARHYLERVRANTVRMKKLIEDLLEISRLKKRGSIIEEVAVGELISEVKMRLEYTIKQKNVEIAAKDSLPKIFCDRVRLTEVFLNLVSNAIKFTDKPKPVIEIGYGDKGDFHEFYVRDNGIGIKKEYFDKIFEVFQRLGRREDAEGTGAGLTIVKKIVQMHNGKIWLESKIGEGSVFYFTIPKQKSAVLGKKLVSEIPIKKKLVKEEIEIALERQRGVNRPKTDKGGQNGTRA